MVELLLTVIACLLTVVLGVVVFLAKQVWQFLPRLVSVEDGQKLCPHHFRGGGAL